MRAKNGFILLMAIVLGVALRTSAQVTTAELSGTITDATGAVVPGAKVVVTSAETAMTREALTDYTGMYFLDYVPPGNYTVAVEAKGFRKLVRTGIQLQVNQRAKLDLNLQVGEFTEVVNVKAAAPLLETQSSTLGSVISERFVNELPLNGRNFVQLAILTPGVNGVGFSVPGTIMSGSRPDDRRPGSELFSNGNREGSNNFLYDGVDNNERLTLSIVLRPAVEAVKEFKVQTNLYNADLGRNSGAVVDVITKSGTNELHGSAFEFLRNSAMDARDFFNQGAPSPAFRFNQFGFSLGGPVFLPSVYSGKNRTFFFADYEGFRRTSLRTLTATVPTVAMRGGDFTGIKIYDPLTTRQQGSGFVRTEFQNDQIPSSSFDPVTAKLINAYPLPQNSRPFNNYVANLTQTQSWNQADARVDHQLSPKDTFFVRWSIQHTSTVVPNTFPPLQLPGLLNPVSLGNEDSFAGTSFSPDQHAVANYVHVFSPKLINELRVGFNRFVLDYTAEGAQPGLNLGNKLGVPNSNWTGQQSVLPIFSPANFAGIGHSRSLPIFRRENTLQYVDNMTRARGLHTLKFGADIRRRQITEFQTNRGNGRFNFSPAFTAQPGVGGTGNAMASFLLGYASLIEQDYLLAWVGERGVETGLYLADDYRVHRRLTLNLGLRWEYYSPYSEVADRWANFDAATATVKVAGRDGVDSRAGVHRDLRDFAPRFGFAYQWAPGTVLRGGYGIFFNPNGHGGAALRLQRHIPFGPIYSVTPGDITVATRVSDGFPPAPVVNFDSARNPAGGVIGVSADYKSAYAQQFNLTVQHEIAPWQMLIQAAYVGNLGRRLHDTFDLNQPVPGPTSVASRRPFFSVRPGLAGVTYDVSDGLSNYHAFQLTVEKRMNRGLAMLLGYTWSHSIDDVAVEFGSFSPLGPAPQDPRNRRAERSNSSIDMRHRLTVSYLYRFPVGRGQRYLDQGGVANFILGGWQTNGIATLQTGLPFTPTLQTSTTNCCASRPDRLRSGELPSGQQSIDRWFDVTAFVTPAPFTFGNAGRNILFSPGRVNFDISVFKDFPVREQARFQFRAEAFNIFNHAQFGYPNTSIGNAQAGVISSTLGNPRQVQMALRFQF